MDTLENVHWALGHALRHAEEAGDDYKRSAKALNELVEPLALAAIALELREVRVGRDRDVSEDSAPRLLDPEALAHPAPVA